MNTENTKTTTYACGHSQTYEWVHDYGHEYNPTVTLERACEACEFDRATRLDQRNPAGTAARLAVLHALSLARPAGHGWARHDAFWASGASQIIADFQCLPYDQQALPALVDQIAHAYNAWFEDHGDGFIWGVVPQVDDNGFIVHRTNGGRGRLSWEIRPGSSETTLRIHRPVEGAIDGDQVVAEIVIGDSRGAHDPCAVCGWRIESLRIARDRFAARHLQTLINALIDFGNWSDWASPEAREDVADYQRQFNEEVVAVLVAAAPDAWAQLQAENAAQEYVGEPLAPSVEALARGAEIYAALGGDSACIVGAPYSEADDVRHAEVWPRSASYEDDSF